MMSPPIGTPASSPPPAESAAAGPAPCAAHTTRAYPWLLFLSTAMAAGFCFMYITKPVRLAPPLPLTLLTAAARPAPLPQEPATLDSPDPIPAATAPEPAPAEPAPPLAALLPNTDSLPGDPLPDSPAAAVPPLAALAPSPTEETNLHIQHVITATTPAGELSRIVLKVPVLYQSRSLGWTENEVAQSRELLKRLTLYQENSRALREEGSQLLAAWNLLVERSIPTSVLRADSPSLPANQQAAELSHPAAQLNTPELIQIQPAAP